MAFSLCVLFLSLMWMLSLDLGPTLIYYDFLSILNLITSAKTLFPNKVTFSGPGWAWIWGDAIQPPVESYGHSQGPRIKWQVRDLHSSLTDFTEGSFPFILEEMIRIGKGLQSLSFEEESREYVYLSLKKNTQGIGWWGWSRVVRQKESLFGPACLVGTGGSHEITAPTICDAVSSRAVVRAVL